MYFLSQVFIYYQNYAELRKAANLFWENVASPEKDSEP